MTDDPILALERELLGAARRRAQGADADSPGAGHGLRRRLPGALALAASVLVVVVIAGGALLALRSGSRPSRPSTAQLVSPWATRLAIMRRPQDRIDRLRLYRDGNNLPAGTVAPGSVRYARLTPWGAPVLLGVQARGPQHGQLVLAMPAWTSIIQMTMATRRFATGGGSVAIIGPRRQGGTGITRVVMAVADGIVRVRVKLAGAPARSARVVGNVAAVQIAARCCTVHPFARLSVIGYGAGGQVVRRWRPTVATTVNPDGTVDN